MASFSREEVLTYHKGGKVGVRLPKGLKTKEDLCLAYTPGVAQAVKAIAERPGAVYDCTAKPKARQFSVSAISGRRPPSL